MREKDPGGKAKHFGGWGACGIEEGLADVTGGCRRRPLARVLLVPPLPVPPYSVGWLAPAFRTRDENHPPIPRDSKDAFLYHQPCWWNLRELKYPVTSIAAGSVGLKWPGMCLRWFCK